MSDLTGLIFGRLTWDACRSTSRSCVATFAVVALGGLAVFGADHLFPPVGLSLAEWFTSVDHKVGVMYIILGLVMLLRGFADALMMRIQQALSFGGIHGYLPPHHYDQIFTAHGVIMIFFVAMPLVVGLMNIVVPLQIGARDVAFPFLNNFSFWMTVGGAVTVMMSLFVGEFARTGWLAYPPLSDMAYSPDVGVDYYIWSLQVAGVGTLLSGVNSDRHHRQDARAGHDPDEDADLHLDLAVHQRADRRRLPDPDRRARAAGAGPLRRARISSPTTSAATR